MNHLRVSGLTVLFVALAFVMGGVASVASGETKNRVVVIGLDGTRPDYIMKLIDAGKLPNIAKLAQNGVTGTILPPLPPPSPVSWSTFETGMNPGKHGVYGFRRMRPGTYNVESDTSDVAKPFWEYLSDAGKTGIVVNLYQMQGNAPAKPIKGVIISGMGVPNPLVPYTLLSTAKPKARLTPIVLKPATGWTDLPNSYSPPLEAKVVGGAPGYLLLIDTVDEGITSYDQVIYTQSKEAGAPRYTLEQGKMSDVIDVKLANGRLGRFYLILMENTVESETSGTLTVYNSPINSSVESIASDPGLLLKNVPENIRKGYVVDGPMSAQGIVLGNYGLFEDQMYRTELVRSELLQSLLKTTDWDYMITNLTSTDRIQHMLWHASDPKHPMYTEEFNQQFGDAFDRYYEFIDGEIGKILAAAKPDEHTTVIIMSDHGFSGVYRGFSVNEFLRLAGLLVVKDEAKDKTSFRVPDDIDWAKTKAVAFDIDPQIRINLKGREPQGIVNPGSEYEALKAELAALFEDVVDPKTGQRVVAQVYDQSKVYEGPFASEAGDLRIAFSPTYKSLDTSGAGFPKGLLFTDVTAGWSGDHIGRPEDYRGLLIISGAGVKHVAGYNAARMEDLAPTIMHLMGVAKPAGWDTDGRVLDVVKL